MYLSIAGCVKNEAPYLKEYVAFHRLQGVDHFFFYENCSTDDTYELLLKMQHKGLVTVEQMKAVPVQFKAYNKALKDHGKKTKWMALIDLDEFLLSPAGNLQMVLKRYEKYAGVTARWVFFGSNGHETKTNGLVIERFTKRALLPDKHVKSIVQPAKTYKVGNDPHTFRTKGKVVDEHEYVMPKDYAITYERRTIDILRINHYHCKSREEAQLRWTTCADPGTNVMRPFERNFPVYDINEMDDYLAAGFAFQVKREIESWKL